MILQQRTRTIIYMQAKAKYDTNMTQKTGDNKKKGDSKVEVENVWDKTGYETKSEIVIVTVCAMFLVSEPSF